MVSTLYFVGVVLLMAIRGASQVAFSSWRVRSSYSASLTDRPIGTQKPNITMPRTERVLLASAALDTALDRLGADGLFTDGESFYYVVKGSMPNLTGHSKTKTIPTQPLGTCTPNWRCLTLPQIR
jgi:hypothetical protein